MATKKVGTFYPLAVSTHGKHSVLIYGLKSAKKTRIFLAKSSDGLKFSPGREVHIFSDKGKEEALVDCEKLSFFSHGREGYLMYDKKIRGKRRTMAAWSDDMLNFKTLADESDLPEVLTVISDHKHNKKSFLSYFGSGSIYLAASSDLASWHTTGALLSPRKGYFDDGALNIVGTVIVDRGMLVLYEAVGKKKNDKKVKLGASLFSFDKPYVSAWRSEVPFFEEDVEKNKYPARFLGVSVADDVLNIYWSSLENEFFVKTINLTTYGFMRAKDARQLLRHHSNPILMPIAKNKWEQEATFNPAAIHLDGRIHLIYRAIGENGVSVFGYASSKDGFKIDERLEDPIFAPVQPLRNIGRKNRPTVPSRYVSGGSWAGCEDPRLTCIADRIYMTYVAFDGCNPPGVALTSISVDDFLHKIWKWKHPVYISKPGEIQKNWMVFPEKINGKYAILHSITPNISIEYVDDLDSGEIIIESCKKPGLDEHRWDNIVRGAGAPPLETKYGWLVLYHAMDKRDPNRYKVGAMILDKNDPEKILYRSKHPILEPTVNYENHGAKAGVVYVCGAVIKENILFVYYGGADKVVCVATEDLDAFLTDMTRHAAKASPMIKKTNKLNYL